MHCKYGTKQKPHQVGNRICEEISTDTIVRDGERKANSLLLEILGVV